MNAGACNDIVIPERGRAPTPSLQLLFVNPLGPDTNSEILDRQAVERIAPACAHPRHSWQQQLGNVVENLFEDLCWQQ